MWKIDHHLHTARHSPDSVIDPYDLLERLRDRELNGVVITEHDHQWDPEELAELASKAPDLTILSGAEVSAIEGHFLVYGLPNLDDAPPGISLKDLIQVVRRHDAAIVAAHPFRWDQPFDRIFRSVMGNIDALEVVSNNHTPATRGRTEEVIFKVPRLGSTGSSDAHELNTVGCYYSEIARPIKTMRDFVRAIRERATKPRHHAADSWHACGLTDE